MASTASMPAYMLPGVSVHQPTHLEGDPTLATEILPGPPSLVSAQQSAQKRDPRKPSTAFSYLPASDPGSTYSGIMHGTLVGQDLEGPRTKRTRVDKGAATGRAQRASARNQNGATSALDPPVHSEAGISTITQPISVDSDPFTMVVDDDPPLSRANSSLNVREAISTGANTRGKRRDKGKGKEIEPSIVRVKEEPKAISLHTPEPVGSLVNNDHCSSCRSTGALVYCDGCPRAFHLWCLDPPMESVDEGDSRWFCPGCSIRKHPPCDPPSSFLAPLIRHVETNIPIEFQLPDDVRAFFKDVATGPKGTYVDNSEIKQPRLNRHGQLEDRDAYRLRDRNGAPVLCFRCGTSALPTSVAAAAPAAKRARRSTSKVVGPETGKGIISCDYCSLHWHLDCLDPPLSTMPSFTKKWMCPNHAEQILPLKRRIPKQNASPIEVTKPKQFNNGNIEIIHPETSASQAANRVSVDEVLINGRRYRVPERVIVLDFWSKVGINEGLGVRELDVGSGMSSPLTSLSSLDDLDDHILPTSEPRPVFHDAEDLRVAQVLCNLQIPRPVLPSPTTIFDGVMKDMADSAVQTEPELERVAVHRKSIRAPRASTSMKRASVNKITNGSSQHRLYPMDDSTITPAALITVPTTSSAKRRKAAQGPQPEPSTRELRSRSKNDTSLTSISSRSSIKRADEASRESLLVDSQAPVVSYASISTGKPKTVHVKLEEADNTSALANASNSDPGPSLPPLSKAPYRRIRAARRVIRRDPEPEDDHQEPKEQRGRKRKERDHDQLEAVERPQSAKKEKEKKEKPDREKKKMIHTPSNHRGLPLTNGTPSVPTITTAPLPAPTTPSLKIRLPRLSNIHIQNSSPAISTPMSSIETPTRL